MLSPSKSPRPILKHASTTLSSSIRSARVHFPPSPRLSTFQFTHSPQLYDRSPLVVQPNVCALPARGERVYLAEDYDNSTQDDIIRDSIPLRDGYYLPLHHPCEAPSYLHPFDYSSSSSNTESDESDSSLSTPPDLTNTSATLLILTHHSDLLGPSLSRRRSDSDVLGFLPHPPATAKPKRSKRSNRMSSDNHPLHCTFSEGSFSTSALEGCLGGF